MDEVFVISAARKRGSPKPSKVLGQEFFLSREEAEAKLTELQEQSAKKYTDFIVYRATLEILAPETVEAV